MRTAGQERQLRQATRNGGSIFRLNSAVLFAGMIFVSTCLTALPAKADYILGSGDTIELTVFGRPDLNRRARVDIDGNVTLPLIGEIKASGVSLADLRARIRGQIEASDAIRSSDVVLELFETRPFYIHGDVARSGAYPYYKGLTVRHAIALAGGLDTARGKATTTPREIAEVRGRYNLAKGEMAKLQVRVAALQAEIANSDDFDPSLKAQIAKVSPQDLVAAELQNLKARTAERQKEQDYLKSSLRLANEEVAALERSQQTDAEARKQQVAEMERIAELSSKGLAASGRLTEEQRATVLLKSREMDTAARLALARRQREEIIWNIAKSTERHFIALDELNTAVARLAEARLQVDALSEQIALLNAGRDQSTEENVVELEIRIFRNGSPKDGIGADEDVEMLPGDVVEIRQRLLKGNKGL